MDAESEHLVQEAIDRAMKGRTVVVIAHRLSTVRDASQVGQFLSLHRCIGAWVKVFRINPEFRIFRLIFHR